MIERCRVTEELNDFEREIDQLDRDNKADFEYASMEIESNDGLMITAQNDYIVSFIDNEHEEVIELFKDVGDDQLYEFICTDFSDDKSVLVAARTLFAELRNIITFAKADEIKNLAVEKYIGGMR